MELWTREHAISLLPTIAVMLLVAAVLRVALKKKSWEVRMIPFHVLSAVLVLLEIGKQVVSVYRGYDLYHLPFHFCSLFIFMLPFMSLYRGKYVRTVGGITAALCGAVTVMMLGYPSLIYGAGDVRNFFTDYLSFHTVMFHGIVVFAFILIIALQLHVPNPHGEQKGVTIYILCFCAISATMAQLLQTNYNNFYSCNIGPLETLRLSIQGVLGYGVTQVLYVLIVTVLDVFFVLGAYWLYRGLRSLVTPKRPAIA